MLDYMETIINGIKTWVSAKIDREAVAVTKLINNAQTAADNAQTAADNAQTAADNAQTAVDNLEIGDILKSTLFATGTTAYSGQGSGVLTSNDIPNLELGKYYEVYVDGTLFYSAVCKSGKIWGFESADNALVLKQPDGNEQSKIFQVIGGGHLGAISIEWVAANLPLEIYEVEQIPGKYLYESVTSINGEKGDVTLTAEDVGALPDDTEIPTVPETLPNPNKLIFTGAVEAEYDGSEAVTVEIPEGGSEDVLPEYSETDNGKVLGIVDGALAWVKNSHSVTWNLTNVTSSSGVTSVSGGAALVAVLTAEDGYILGDVTVTMGGTVLTDVWNADTRTIIIPSVTGDVVVSCTVNELSESLITFTIGAVTYTAEKGMTWGEWVKSAYNIYGFYVGKVEGDTATDYITPDGVWYFAEVDNLDDPSYWNVQHGDDVIEDGFIIAMQRFPEDEPE